MSRRKTFQRIAATALLAAGSALTALPAAEAQEDPNRARGFSPGEVYDFSGIDSINLFNGGLSVNLPVGPRYPVGDGLSYGLHLSYSSSTWEAESTWLPDLRMVPRSSANAGHGWMLSLAEMLYDRPGPPPGGATSFEWESPDGSAHRFYGTLHHGAGENDPCFHTRDNTYLRMCSAPSQGGLQRYTVEFPDGRIQTYEAVPLAQRLSDWDDERFRVVRIEDRLGNWVTVTYTRVSVSKLTWTIQDSVGRSHTVDLSKVTVDGFERWWVDVAKLAKFGGAGTANYELVYENETIHRSCWSNPTLPGEPTISVPLLREVILPTDGVLPADRERYRFPTYNAPSSGQPAQAPELESLSIRAEQPVGLCRSDGTR